MALTVCLKCDKSYGERNPQCPHCGAHNFFSDDDTLLPAVNVLIEQLHHEGESDKTAKLAELQDVRHEIMPHTRPLWMKVWDAHRESIIIFLIMGAILAMYATNLISWGN